MVDVNQLLPWFFTPWPREDSFSVSRALGRICERFSRFQNIMLQELTPVYVKTTRGIFVECFSEETQIIDIFTHYKLLPHKISQYTLATRLSSCQRWGNPLCQSVRKTMETVDWRPRKLRFKQTEKTLRGHLLVITTLRCWTDDNKQSEILRSEFVYPNV